MIPRDRARILVVGVGGLGTPAALALAHAGIGTLVLSDDDNVEVSNLHRQILFGDGDVGRSKVAAAADALRRIPRHPPSLRVDDAGGRFLPTSAAKLLEDVDVVVEGSDNFATKFLVADACARARVPVVHGAAVRWHGTVLAVGPAGAPCYRCLFEAPPEGGGRGCAEAGVVGPVVGILGAVQADLALRLLEGRPAAGTLFTFDGRADVGRFRQAPRRPTCSLCGEAAQVPLALERPQATAPGE